MSRRSEARRARPDRHPGAPHASAPRGRAAAVLAALAGSEPGRDVPPDPDPAVWGARGAVARAWGSSSVVAGVYTFDSYADARAVEDRLADVDQPAAGTGRSGVTGVNGSLLLWATADVGDARGQDLLVDLQSAFAGEE